MPRVVRPEFKIKGDRIVTLEGEPIKSKRDAITEFLRQRGDHGAYVAEMFRGWKVLCNEVGKSPGTYESFRQAIHLAKNDGLIEPFREEKGDHYYPRVYYRIKVYR
jgi:hypothetical protein